MTPSDVLSVFVMSDDPRALRSRTYPIDPLSGTFWLCVVCSVSLPSSSDSPPPSLPCSLRADTLTLALPCAHARLLRTHTHTPSCPSLSRRLIHSAAPSTHRFGAGRGAGWDINLPRGGHELHSDWTHLQCKDHKQEDSEAGSRSTNTFIWSSESLFLHGLSAGAPDPQPIGRFADPPVSSGCSSQTQLVVNSLEFG